MHKSSPAADLAYIAVFAALIIVFAFVSVPVGSAGVPIVLQNAVIILAGLLLGPRRGTLAVALVLLLGLVGLPVLAGGRTTLAALAGPTAGYLVGYLVSAFVAGAIAYRAPVGRRAVRVAFFILAGAAALVCQYACGTVGLVLRADLTFAAASLSQLVFVLPDAAKVGVMIVVALGVHAAFPDLLARQRRSRTVEPYAEHRV